MASKRLQKLADENPDIIDEVDYDEDGYWIYLRDGYLSTSDTHTVHEDTWADLIRSFKSIRAINPTASRES